MNKKVVISLLAVLLVVGLLVFLFDRAGDPDRAKSISSNWVTKYARNSTDPKGMAFFDQLLETYVTDSVYSASSYEKIDSLKLPKKSTFLFIGDEMALLDHELEGLMQKVDSGATAIFAFEQFDKEFYAEFFENSPFYWEYSSRTFIALGDTSLPFYAVHQNDTISDDWYSFDPQSIKDSTYNTFIYSMNKPVAFSLKKGKGKVILHSMPQLFFNYQVLRKNGFMHAKFMLKQMKSNQPVVWLEFARFDHNKANANTGNEGDSEKEDNSFIKLIMQNGSLRWAFILAIGIFLLYAAFRAKRRQAVLPGIPEKRNMSLAFVETLSSIYLSRNSPYGILLVLRKNFYQSVNRYFYIDLNQSDAQTNADKYEHNVKRLIEKSNFDEKELRDLLGMLATRPARSHEVSNESLGRTYSLMRKFYLSAGINKPVSHFDRDQEKYVRRMPIIAIFLTLLSIFSLLRGVYGLAKGSEFGILLVILGVLLLIFAIRFTIRPVAKLTKKQIIVYHPVIGRKKFEVTDETTYSKNRNGITFYNPDGRSVTIPNMLLNHKGQHTIKLFTEHLKKRTS